jgi:Tol biopolymer transport system component
MSRQLQGLPRPSAGLVVPAIAVVALVVVGVLTIDIINGNVPGITSSRGGQRAGPALTPTPSNVVIVPSDPRSKVPGEILYVKAGNIWVQSGSSARQLTSSGADAMPSFSADGTWIYYIETHFATGRSTCAGPLSPYQMSVPVIMRLRADGSGQPEPLKSGQFTQGGETWFYFVREPVPAPDGSRLALVSDAPQPCFDDVVLQLFDLASRRLTVLTTPETPPLGQQDPAWSPDGSTLLFVRNDRSGARGTPVIYRYNLETGRSTAITGPGYLQPAWSPDGRYIAVTHLDSFGSDIVVLDARNGHELLRLTGDDASTAPIWSPAGNAIAYLHVTSGVADLVMITLSGTAPNWTAGTPIQLTELAGLDPASRPSWFVPPDQLPQATPVPPTAPTNQGVSPSP